MRRRGVGTSMPRSLSNTGSPSIAMRPRSGRRMPAMALTTEVLPAPERPKSAVTPAPASNEAARRKSPSPRSMSTDSIFPRYPARGAAHHHLGNVERGKRQQHRDDAQAHRGFVAGWSLRIGIDSERQRARLAGDVRHESDGRAELAEAARKGEQHAGDDAGESQRQSHGEKYSEPARAQRARGGLELAVYRLERKPDRAHHQRETHDARRERGAGPAERDDDAEPLLEDRAQGPAPAEQQQKEEPDHDGWEHQRQVHDRIEQRFPGEARARQRVRHRHREGEADDDTPERDSQAQP